jgi:spore germination protein YaaH
MNLGKNKKTILTILVVLELLLISALGYTVLSTQDQPTPQQSFTSEDTTDISFTQEEENKTVENQDIEEEASEYILEESAWLPPWYFDEAFQSLKKYKDILDIANPVFYSVSSNATLAKRVINESLVQEFLNYCKNENIAVIPTVGSYSYEVTENLFYNKDTYRDHIENIIEEIEQYDFDGIDLDYEKIRREDKDHYIDFLEELSQELRKREKLLSVTVFAQWKDDNYQNHADTIYAQDLSEISEIADQIRVMTYDYTLATSPTPGPIAPIDWMEEVIQYTLTKVDKEKIWLGIHLYGYRWKDGEATAFTPETFKSIVNNPQINTEFKQDIAEGYAQYSCDNSTCYLYYQTEQGVNLRRDLASEYELAGVSYWSVGRDDGLLFE